MAGVTSDPGREGWQFVRHLSLAAAPLLVWAGHFFASYVAVAAVCTVHHGQAPALLRVALLSASVLAMIAALLLLRSALRRRRSRHAAGRAAALADGAALGCAVLAVIGIAWSALPMLLLQPC